MNDIALPFKSQGLHLHLISMHTSPLAQPGSGDAGGMNVYIDRSLREMLRRYRQLSVEVFTLLTEPLGRQVQQISERAVIHYISLPQAVGASKEDLPGLVADFAAAMSRTARSKPDLIHAHYWLSGLAALEADWQVPLVQTMHTTAAAKDARAGFGEKLEPQVRYLGEKKLAAQAAALVVNTELEAEQMQKFYGAAPERLAVIAPGVDTGIFRPLSSQPPLHAGSDRAGRLVFAGRLQPLKGAHLLVEALSLLAEDLQVELLIIGQDTAGYGDRLLKQVQQAGLQERVRFLAPLSAWDLASQFRQADIVACPSSSETFGLVALEAQACGTAVLASDVDGLRSAVQDSYSGLLVQPRTGQAWAQAIEHLVRHPQLRLKLGQQARARALQMRWSDTADALIKLYYNLSDPVLGEGKAASQRCS